MSFGECIKRRRRELGLTQREVGERLGVTDVMIRIYEADQRHPKMSTAKRFAEALDMDFSYLVGASPEALSKYDKAVYDIGKTVMNIVEDACDRCGIPVERLVSNDDCLGKIILAILYSEMRGDLWNQQETSGE